MTTTKIVVFALVLSLAALTLTGCSKPNPAPPPAAASNGQTPAAGQGYTARSGHGVDVLYFEEGNPCECMEEFGVVIKNTVNTHFANELRNGTLRFFVVVSDDPSNRETLEVFGKPLYDLFIVEFEEGRGTATPVREIWSMMGDDEALELYVKARVQDALSRQR